MAPFELGLPQMMMRVDEARANDLAAAVYKLSASGCDKALANLGNTIGLDQDICLS